MSKSKTILWNHILRDAKDWLKRCGENEQNAIETVKQIRCLLESPSKTKYQTLLHGDSDVRG